MIGIDYDPKGRPASVSPSVMVVAHERHEVGGQHHELAHHLGVLVLEDVAVVDRAEQTRTVIGGRALRRHRRMLLVGVTGDPAFGPLVTFGLGGTKTDLAVDRVHRLVPLSAPDAEEMLTASRAGALLFDPQRDPPLDRSAVVDTVVRIGRLADELPAVAELDLNPVVVGANGCVVLDARIRLAPVPAVDPALRALGC